MDGVMYPSANTEGAGINRALKKEFVDKKILSCEIAMMFSVQRNPSKHKDITVVPASREVRVDDDGSIYFSNIW